MKHLKTLSLFFIALLMLNLSCSKDDDAVKEEEEQEQETGDGIDFTQESINIILPTGSSLDLTNYKVRSVVDDFDINPNGSSTANFLDGNTNIAYVIDENENPILAGFMNAEKREISVRTTVEVSTFYNLGTIFLPAKVRELYINNISTAINIDETVSNSESIFESNSNLISSESFLAEIQTLTKMFTDNLEDFSEESKTSSGVKIDDRTLSGIRLLEESGNNILFRNTIRRRAHAFLYKTKTKDENGNETVLINDVVSDNADIFKQVSIPPTAAVTSVIGLLQTIVSGKGLEIGAINSEPTNLTITDDNIDSETYQARVVGPGLPPVPDLTQEEFQKLTDLNIETFAFDILLPIIGMAIGADGSNIFNGLKPDNPNALGLINFVTAGIGAINGGNEAAKKGDFTVLTRGFIEGVIDGTLASSFEGVVKNSIFLFSETSTGNSLSAAAGSRIANAANKFFIALKAADLVLQGVDLARISYAIASSNNLENFDITVDRGSVSLEPFQAKTKTGGEDILYTAEVNGQNLEAGQAFEYVWTCSGDEGILVATNKDETHPTTITTSVNQIKYRAQGSNGSDDIKVEVFIKQGVNRTRVNDQIAVVNILEFEMKITPNNQKISGGTSIQLSVVDENGKDFSKNEESEYSFVWKTDGQFGKYNGTRNTVTKDVNKIRYEALERTQEGLENISVSVYRKAKGTNEGFRFLQTVEGTINIDNDPKKKYMVLSPIYTVKLIDDIDPSCVRNFLNKSTYVNKIENAISYRLELSNVVDGIGRTYPDRTITWNPNATTYSNPVTQAPTDKDEGPDVSGYAFRVSHSSASASPCGDSYDYYVNLVSGTNLTAQLTVTLE